MSTEHAAPFALTQQRRPISRAQIEAVVSRSVAFAGLLFAAQTFPVMLGQAALLHTSWLWAYNVVIFGGLLLGAIASILRRFVRAVNTLIAFAYLAAMATWPLATLDPDAIAEERPWLWFLCTISTAAASIAFTRWWATLYLVIAPSVYGIIRLTPSGGQASWDMAALDTVYAMLLGGAVLIIVTMLRDAGASVDTAQATALARYALAVRQHATEVERVHVDSIVHDSVLATLTSAARAFSPEAMALSATMADNAIGHLTAAAVAAPDDDSLVSIDEVALRISDTAATLYPNFTRRVRGVGAGAVSVQVAEALHSATVQSMVNSLQHAGGCHSIERWLRITGFGADGLDIEVGDTGSGFDVDAVPAERIGLFVSIVERITNVGGSANIATGPGEGAVISIRWPDADAGGDEVES